MNALCLYRLGLPYFLGLTLLSAGLTAGVQAAMQDADGDGLPDDWERGFGRYEIVRGNFSWSDAKADAERRGGHLATILSEKEWADFKAVLGAELFGKNLWLGGTDEGSEGQWRWVTGEKWEFTHWRVNEPNNDSIGNGQGAPENYLMIWGNETDALDNHLLFWNDVTLAGGGLARDGYVLEAGSWTRTNAPDSDGDGLSDAEEQFPTGTYEVVEGQYTWESAKETAEVRRGRLACIYFEADWQRVRVLLSGRGMWIGGMLEGSSHEWTWVSRRPFIFSRWAPFRPLPHSGIAYLFMMDSGGNWFDSDISETGSRFLDFILERGVPPLTDPNRSDTDGDGLNDGEELNLFKTDPNRSDSDSDGLTDFEEVRHWMTNPLDKDTDFDSLSDSSEVLVYHTDPNRWDSDGDGYTDKFEVDHGSDPAQAASVPGALLTIRTAIEIEFTTERGLNYQIQSIDSDGNLHDFGPTFAGNGAVFKSLFSSKDFPNRRWNLVFKATNSSGMVFIPPGTFVMGSPASEAERSSDETQHPVTLTKGFWMGQHEVTQGEYLSVLGLNLSYFRDGVNAYSPGSGGKVTNELRHPVEQVNWIDATNYCEKLTQRDRAAGLIPANYAYRLPTEAEWEYACRAGTTNAFSFGTAIRQGMANFNTRNEYDSLQGTQAKSDAGLIDRTIEVGSYPPNAYGLYDMHGNVWEWCADRYGDYPAGSVTDPTGPTSGVGRVIRGGSWNYFGRYCRAAYRGGNNPVNRSGNVGFRVVLAPGR